MHATQNTDAISSREAPNGRPSPAPKPAGAIPPARALADAKRQQRRPLQVKKLLLFARAKRTSNP